MCNKEVKYINVQNGEELDWDRVSELKDNAMLKAKPELWIEWDFEKNNELGLNIYKVAHGSGRNAWFVCDKCNNRYEVILREKVRKNKECTFCLNERLKNNSLASLRPDIAKEWHPTKNGTLTPHDATIGSSQKVWWLCTDCNFESTRIIKHMVNALGCRKCNNTLTLTYDLVKERIEKMNYQLLVERDDFVIGCPSYKVKCDRGHISNLHRTTINRGGGCQKCFYENNRGENNHNWSGGVSPVSEVLRESLWIWRKASLEKANYICDITGIDNDALDIHHLIPFRNLVMKTMNNLSLDYRENIDLYSIEERNSMNEEIKRLHMNKLGVPLIRSVHILFHSIFGRIDTNESQYIFFKKHYKKFKDGDFTKIDYENYLKGIDK